MELIVEDSGVRLSGPTADGNRKLIEEQINKQALPASLAAITSFFFKEFGCYFLRNVLILSYPIYKPQIKIKIIGSTV